MIASRSPTYIGRVDSVVGNNVHVLISPDITHNLFIDGGVAYRVGQVGSFLKIPLGYVNLYGVVTQIGSSAILENAAKDSHIGNAGDQWVTLSLVGEQIDNSFERGVAQFPTVGDKVHMVTIDDLSVIYGEEIEKSSIQVGNISVSESLPAKLDINRLITRHCAIVGSTGSGKSNTTAVLLREIANKKQPELKKARILIIDPHGEYSESFGDNAQVFSIEGGNNQHKLYLPFWMLSFDELVKSISEESLDDKRRDYIREKLVQMKIESNERLGIGIEKEKITEDTPIPFSIKKLWFQLDDFERRTLNDRINVNSGAIKRWGDPEGMISSVYEPVSTGNVAPFVNNNAKGILRFLDSMRNKVMNSQLRFLYDPTDYSVKLEKEEKEGGQRDKEGQSEYEYTPLEPKNNSETLLQSWLGSGKKITTLDLSSVPSEIKSTVSGTILSIIYDALFWGQNLSIGGKQQPILIVLEEAHTYLRAGGKSIASRITQKIAKEGRKYGCGLLLVTQRPSELDETILSQCGTLVALRLNNSKDRGHISSAIQDELQGITDLLPSLKTGEGLITGEAVKIPSRVKFHEIENAPKSADPDVIEEWSKELPSNIKEAYATLAEKWRNQTF